MFTVPLEEQREDVANGEEALRFGEPSTKRGKLSSTVNDYGYVHSWNIESGNARSFESSECRRAMENGAQIDVPK